MKKTYQTPSTEITVLGLTQMLAASVTGTDGNAGIGYGGGGSGPARTRQHSIWDNDWSNEE
ncbi:MAG: hypothetical protein J6M53_08475 [Bacteroidaceae bacterium]|nr:hypothetical protein [Bacteroidaceae bacterium]